MTTNPNAVLCCQHTFPDLFFFFFFSGLQLLLFSRPLHKGQRPNNKDETESADAPSILVKGVVALPAGLAALGIDALFVAEVIPSATDKHLILVEGQILAFPHVDVLQIARFRGWDVTHFCGFEGGCDVIVLGEVLVISKLTAYLD